MNNASQDDVVQDSLQDGNIDSDEDTAPSRLYALHRHKQVVYTYTTMLTVIMTSDEPKLSKAIKSPERELFVSAIAEEFQTMCNRDN